MMMISSNMYCVSGAASLTKEVPFAGKQNHWILNEIKNLGAAAAALN